MITKSERTEAILQEGKADVIAVAREMLRDPYWQVHAAQALGLPDWLEFLPPVYSARLRSREEELLRTLEAIKKEFPFRRKEGSRAGFLLEEAEHVTKLR